MKILLSAGEASGDTLGAGLANALRQRLPEVQLIGMGGPKMEAAGVKILQDYEPIAVVGLWEVLKNLTAIRKAMATLEEALDEHRPDLVIPIDFPDFNLRLAKRVKQRGLKTVYLVSPQIWAWRQGRVHQIKALVERMLVLFPFESKFYEAAQVPVTYVGHPIVERIPHDLSRDQGLQAAGLDGTHRWVGILPGSRQSEVSKLLPIFLEAAKVLSQRQPGLGFVLPKARTLPRTLLDESLAAVPELNVQIVEEDAWPEVLAVMDAAWVASGTASLETALACVPSVIAYRMHPLTSWLAKRLIKVQHVGLPNLVLERRVAPECIQADCNPQTLASTIEPWLTDPAQRLAQQESLRAVRQALGSHGAFERAAEAILPHLSGKIDR